MEKVFRCWVSAAALMLILAACQPRSEATPPRSDGNTPKPADNPPPQGQTNAQRPGGAKQWSAPPEMSIDVAKAYFATISTTMGDIDVKLLVEDAPRTVNNFVFLAREGFYENVKFHRIIKDFMVQTGDPTGTGSGGPGYRFPDEPVVRKYEKGILAMANAGPNTNGSQFFIVHGSAVNLPPNYTIFGTVTRGMDVVDAIASSPVGRSPSGEQSMPQTDIRIKLVGVSSEP